jgi:transcriptional regulator with XRE-family HTH domain
MNGADLRAWRTSRDLYQRDLVALVAEAGTVTGVDQPMVSEWERGLEPVPDAVAAILEAHTDAIPVTREPTPAPAPRRARRNAQARESKPREPKPEPAADDDGLEPEPAGDEPAADPDAGDVAPKPIQPRGPAPARAEPWNPAVRSQLESDLRALFAGETFMVPVPVINQATGEVELVHEPAEMPGIATIVGAIDKFDGEVIRMNAAQMARAWAELADESPRVRRFLILLTYGGAWRGVIAATLPVVYSIGVHHGLIPPVLGGAGAAPQRMVEHDGAGVA